MPERRPRPEPAFDWFIPIDGDGTRLGTVHAERPPTFDYLRDVVVAAEAAGYRSLLIPTRFANGLFDEAAPLAETWTTATALAAVTERIRFLVAVRPGYIHTGLFAQMVAAFDAVAPGRIDLNVVPGGIQGDSERLGEAAGHDDRYARAEEFIDALRALWAARGEPTGFAGEYVQLAGALCSPAPSVEPRFYTGGASPRALGLAGSRADVLLAWIQPLEATAKLLADARAAFERCDRPPHFGLRTHLVLGETEDEAWRKAAGLIAGADPAVLAQRNAAAVGTPMVGARAQAVRVEDDRLGDRLWNGLSRVRVNCGTAIVGTAEQVAGELHAYWLLGFDEFILSGYPHREEAGRVAAEVLPRLRDRIGAVAAKP